MPICLAPHRAARIMPICLAPHRAACLLFCFVYYIEGKFIFVFLGAAMGSKISLYNEGKIILEKQKRLFLKENGSINEINRNK
jgi:hypothetical protein